MLSLNSWTHQISRKVDRAINNDRFAKLTDRRFSKCHQVATLCQPFSLTLSLSLSRFYSALAHSPSSVWTWWEHSTKTCTTSKRTCAPASPSPNPIPIPIPIPDLQTRNSLLLTAQPALASTAKPSLQRNADFICRQRLRQCENKAQRVQNPKTDAVQQQSLDLDLALSLSLYPALSPCLLNSAVHPLCI